MPRKINSTSLRIDYKIDTGNFHEYYRSNSNAPYHAGESFTYEYTRWLEEKFVEIYNDFYVEVSNHYDLLEYVEREIENLAEEFNSLEEENTDLSEENVELKKEVEKLKKQIQHLHPE